MNKFYILLLFCMPVLLLKAQAQPATQTTQPYGIIDTADLKMTSCDFEKDANAEVLFDKAEVETGFTSTTMLRHKRIKILNGKGKDAADITINFYSRHGVEDISDVQAETINLVNNKIEFIKIDKSLIYTQNIDKTHKKITFSFPQVKAGSVIEYSYKLTLGFTGGFPDWNFQQDMPVRYSELKASIRSDYAYKMISRVYTNYEKNTTEPWIKGSDTIGHKYDWVIKNIPSFTTEAYSTSEDDNIQGMQFILTAYKFYAHGELRQLEDSWFKIRGELISEDDFGGQLNEKIENKELLSKLKSLTTDAEKIHYIFNYVKDNIKWNSRNSWYPLDGVKKIWDKKTGNCTEINLVLGSFLRQAGFKCYLEIASTRNNGKPNQDRHEIDQFNKTVVVVKTKEARYVLDASDKYGLYTDIPFDILNAYALVLNPDTAKAFIAMINEAPSRKIIAVNAQIKPDGKLEGTTQINSFDYHRTSSLSSYNSLGESKYTDRLRDDDNNLKILSFSRENVETDTLPLTENISFRLDLVGSDDTYIYFNPNLFTSFRINPFLSEKRNSIIDFGCNNYFAINGRYKIPGGYKIDALPKSLSLLMPDKSISFKRVVAEQDGEILVHYVIAYSRSIFLKEEYPSIRDFYKKMYEMLNEQIVLKKL